MPPKIAIRRDAIDHKGLWYAQDHIYQYGLKRCLRYGATLYIDGEGMKCKDDARNQLCCVCKEGPIPMKALDRLHLHHVASMPMMTTVKAPPLQRSSSFGKRTIEEASGDGTDPFAEPFEQAKKSRTARLEGELVEVERMRKALNKMKDRGCALCLVAGNPSGRTGHQIFQCPSFDTVRVSCGQYTQWKKTIIYRNHKGICWKCHVPTCGDELHGPLERGKTNCEWEDIVIVTAFGIFRHAEIRTAAERWFKTDWKAEAGIFAQWLSKKPEMGRYSNGMDLLLWYVEEWLGQEQ
jgi:hypothetical protein